jgi:TPR repeat protein
MKERNGFAVVRRPMSSVERTAPGANRVSVGMVAETIALAETKALIELSPNKSPLLESWYQRGIKYYFGKDAPQIYSEAVRWWRKAAERGHAKAQFNLGCCYRDGQGVPQDYVEAVKWHRKAAEQNLAAAQGELGDCYARGEGVPEDQVEAVKWYRKAAEQNDADAQFNMGLCYQLGLGVEENDTEAVKWYSKAAEQGNETAQNRLCCDDLDIVESYKWRRVRANKPDNDYEFANLEYMKKHMTPEQIEKGEALAREFLSKSTQ